MNNKLKVFLEKHNIIDFSQTLFVIVFVGLVDYVAVSSFSYFMS